MTAPRGRPSSWPGPSEPRRRHARVDGRRGGPAVGRPDVALRPGAREPRHPRPREATVRPLPRLVTAVAVATLLAACTDPVQDVITPDEPAVATSPGACTDEQRATFVDAVDGQLAAIADEDWEQALTFASDGFRSDIDAPRFRSIILDGFPVVAAHEARDIGACRAAGTEATLAVTVSDGDGNRQPLLYLLQRDGDRWGIAGAVPPGGAGDDEPALTA